MGVIMDADADRSPAVGVGITHRRPRATITVGDFVTKTFDDPSAAQAEADWYRRVPWAAPKLLQHDDDVLILERLPTAFEDPDWRPAAELRELLGRLHRAGIHHRDVHVKNIVRGPGDYPLLIDWECAVQMSAAHSYDLHGPDVSGVPVPDIHRGLTPQWWGSRSSMSINRRWNVSYQDTATVKGVRDCAGRYDMIANELQGMRGFTVLDLGAYTGYFSTRLAAEFGATVTAVDNHNDLHRAVAGHPSITPITRRMSPANVFDLGAFDVVLALSFLHHVPEWESMLTTLIAITDKRLFIEAAQPDEVLPKAVAHCPELSDAIDELPGEILGYTPGYKSQILRPLKVIRR